MNSPHILLRHIDRIRLICINQHDDPNGYGDQPVTHELEAILPRTPVDMQFLAITQVYHAEVGAKVADFFTERGYTRFLMVGAGDPRATARRDGFVRRIAERGGTLVAERRMASPSGIMEGRQALRELAGLLDARTALLGSSDLVAFGVLVEAQALGIAVPERLAICGFGDVEIGWACEPAITTVSVDGAEMGRLAAECLLARMNGRPVARRTLVPSRIIARGTT